MAEPKKHETAGQMDQFSTRFPTICRNHCKVCTFGERLLLLAGRLDSAAGDDLRGCRCRSARAKHDEGLRFFRD